MKTQIKTRNSYPRLQQEIADRSNGWMYLDGSYNQYNLWMYHDQYSPKVSRVESGSLQDCKLFFEKKDKSQFDRAPHCAKFVPSAKTYVYVGKSWPSGNGWQYHEVTVHKIIDNQLVFVGQMKEGSTNPQELAIQIIAHIETDVKNTDDWNAVTKAKQVITSYAYTNDIKLIDLSC